MELLEAVEIAATAVCQDRLTQSRYTCTHLRMEPGRIIATNGWLLTVVRCETLDVPEPMLMTVDQARLYAMLPEACRPSFYMQMKLEQPALPFPPFARLLAFPEPIHTLYVNARHLADLLAAASNASHTVRLDVYASSVATYDFPPLRVSIEDWEEGARETPLVEMQAVLMPIQPKKVTPDGRLGVHPAPIVQRWAMAIAESSPAWYGEPEPCEVQNIQAISEQ